MSASHPAAVNTLPTHDAVDGHKQPSAAATGHTSRHAKPRAWECRVCTFSENPPHLLRCSLCESRRGSSQFDAPAGSSALAGPSSHCVASAPLSSKDCNPQPVLTVASAQSPILEFPSGSHPDAAAGLLENRPRHRQQNDCLPSDYASAGQTASDEPPQQGFYTQHAECCLEESGSDARHRQPSGVPHLSRLAALPAATANCHHHGFPDADPGFRKAESSGASHQESPVQAAAASRDANEGPKCSRHLPAASKGEHGDFRMAAELQSSISHAEDKWRDKGQEKPSSQSMSTCRSGSGNGKDSERTPGSSGQGRGAGQKRRRPPEAPQVKKQSLGIRMFLKSGA